jgi:hypothetical protein
MPIRFSTRYFSLLNIDSDSDWTSLISLCSDYLLDEDLERLKSVLENTCKSIYIEYNYIDIDYRDTYSNFYSKKFASYPDRTIRLLFFSSIIPAEQVYNIDTFKDSFLGYSVIRPTRISSLGRTILDPRYCSCTKGHISITPYKVHFLGFELSVRGFPFIRQDSDVTVCAHAACWMCFRYFSERYSTYKEAYPFQISQMTSDFGQGRLVPSSGLTISQISEMFSREGFYPKVYDLVGSDPSLFYRCLYYYIESGLPPVVGLPEHAVVAVGHYSDYLKHICPGLISSFHYTEGIIVNDDNLTPYRAIPIDPSASPDFGTNYHLGQVDSFVVPLYEKMFLLAEHAEELITTYLRHDKIGIGKYDPAISIDQMVYRLFLTSSKSYKAKSRNRISNGLGLLYSILPMPRFIWVAELSTHDQYRNRKIIGEMILDATASHKDRFAFMALHYPSALILNNRDSMSKDDRVRLKIFPIKPEGVYPLYENNLVET